MCIRDRGAETSEYLLATEAGYGFVAALGQLHTRGKAGKAALRAADGTKILLPKAVGDFANDRAAVITSAGRLLIFALRELPRLAKGKGVKLISIPAAKFKAGEEAVADLAVFSPGQSLRVHSGRRYLNLKPADLDSYAGARAQRGKLLPRGFRQARSVTVLAEQ